MTSNTLLPLLGAVCSLSLAVASLRNLSVAHLSTPALPCEGLNGP